VFVVDRAEAFADGVLIGPEAAGGGLTDDGDELGVGLVGVVEGAALKDADAEGVEVAGSGGGLPEDEGGFVRLLGVVFDGGGDGGEVLIEGGGVGPVDVADGGVV